MGSKVGDKVGSKADGKVGGKVDQLGEWGYSRSNLSSNGWLQCIESK